MGTFERLHLANNLDALDLVAKKNLDVKGLKFNQMCSLLNKLYKESQQHVLDQEKTYVLLTRYLTIYNVLLNSQPDKKFVELRFGSEYKKACGQYVETARILSERYSHLKESESIPEQRSPQEEVTENITSHQIFFDEFITCRELISALDKKNNLLLVDARPDYDFKESRFDNKNCINVSDHVIASGLSAHALGKRLPLESQKIWEKRDSFDVIVLYDWNTNSENFNLTKLDKLRSALVDWDLNRNYNEKPVVLNGGYLELLQTYPTMCVNPLVFLSKRNNELDELLEIDNIEYPTESDNKSHVMGPEVSEPKPMEIDSELDENETTIKETIIKENKEITMNRKDVISKLLQEEEEWKKLNDLVNKEKDIRHLSELKDKEKRVQEEIAKLERSLEELNERKDEVQKKFESYDLQDEAFRNEDVKQIIQTEEDDNEKLKILDAISEERYKALQKARALKPRSDNGINNNVSNEIVKRTEKPVINRATKPGAQAHYLRLFALPIENMDFGLVGLRNIRNTCYMNTVVQCLSHIPLLIDLFCKGKYPKTMVRTPAAIIFETTSLIRLLWSKNQKCIEPCDFYHKVCTLEPTYRLGNHEDCMEFFLFLLNHLTEDCSYDIRKPDAMTPKQTAWYNQFQGKNSIFIDSFYHQIRIRQHCNVCGQKTFKFEIESTFMLSVPEHDFNLSDLIEEYMADFVIPEYCCARCKQPVRNRKEICYQPEVMVIHLKRYRQVVQNGLVTFRKIESRGHFQKQNFKLGNCYYRLNAIAMHSGDMNYGHYTAACLTPKGWYEFNDEIVRPININDDSVKVKACAFFYSLCDED